jgi:HPt (histidine-containing phosphotransfer) domain-containing protein
MRPIIDLAHLDEQTFGDAELQREVLHMFQAQVPLLLKALEAAQGDARAEIAHRLKGSCLAVGANQLGDAAGLIEHKPMTDQDIQSLSDATLAEVAKILGASTFPSI